MPQNIFDDPEASFLVLVNRERQYSIWPAFMPVPGGWTIALPATQRRTALEYVQHAWTDMRPASLAGEIDGAAGQLARARDRAAAKNGVTGVEDGGLAGGYAAGRLEQADLQRVTIRLGPAGVDLAVGAELHQALDRLYRG